VTPKKGGTTHIGLPVFNTVKEAKAAGMPRAQKKIRKIKKYEMWVVPP
jgi:succinyl-CoA synthetase alpha subunit